jgi:hypothetical protein
LTDSLAESNQSIFFTENERAVLLCKPDVELARGACWQIRSHVADVLAA